MAGIDIGINFPISSFLYHLLIVGATGAGKTRFLRKIIEEISNDVPVVVFDIKGDLTHFYPLQEYEYSIEDISFPLYSFSFEELSELLSLTMAEEAELSQILGREKTLEELENKAREKRKKRILRKILLAKKRGISKLFGKKFDVKRFFLPGIHIVQLKNYRTNFTLLSVFVSSLLRRLTNLLPERRGLKLIMCIDEAHRFFSSKLSRKYIALAAREIRSKGISLIFVTQNLSDLPKEVIANIGNVFIFQLRAYTPSDYENLRKVAKLMNLSLDSLTSLRVGECIARYIARDGTVKVEKFIPLQPFTTNRVPFSEKVKRIAKENLLFFLFLLFLLLLLLLL